jgi:hypothetical protein
MKAAKMGNSNILDIQYSLRKLLYVRPYDLPAIEEAGLKLCDAVVDINMDKEVGKDELIKENSELKEEVRVLRAWLGFEDWVNDNYYFDTYENKYYKMKDGKVQPFSIEQSGIDLRNEYKKLHNI